jgi:two-component system, NtrC family, response regulator AtoC
MRRVLLIETEEEVRKQLLLALREEGIAAEAVSGADAARLLLSQVEVGCVVIGGGSARVPDILESGADAAFPVDVIVALRTDDATAGLAAIQEGAADYVALSGGARALAIAIQKIEGRREASRVAGRASRRAPWGGQQGPEGAPPGLTGRPPAAVPATPEAPALVGNSPKMLALLAAIRQLAPVRANVLIGGESGTGKELVARALHDQSPWRGGPFVPVNCGAIPAGLIESELFGHVRGAFTDAVRDRRGMFEAAHGGTLFLDEIADLPLTLQPKLLRAIQEGEIHRVGDAIDLRVEVRVVAATARDLAAEVAAGRFREDLYYRLSALSVELPALRHRREDIPSLAEHFLERARRRLGVTVAGISEGAMRRLLAHPWPGNVRELENTIERAAVMCAHGEIDEASLPERLTEQPIAAAQSAGLEPAAVSTDDMSIKRATRYWEEVLIRRALQRTQGNRTRAAHLLEISQRALLYKIKEYGIIAVRGTAVPEEN